MSKKKQPKASKKQKFNAVAAPVVATPKLIALAEAGDADGVQAALQRGAKINKQDKRGYTALMAAAKNGNKDVVRILIAHGADINRRDPRTETALTLAYKANHSKIIKMLSEARSREISKRPPMPSIKSVKLADIRTSPIVTHIDDEGESKSAPESEPARPPAMAVQKITSHDVAVTRQQHLKKLKEDHKFKI